MTQVPPPRAVFIDHPVGRTFGRPGERNKHEEKLAAALAQLPNFIKPEQMLQLDCQWDASGSRFWEEEVRNLLLADR
jgi:hypothetical protein